MLDTLTPAERARLRPARHLRRPFEDIGPIVERSPGGGAPARQPRRAGGCRARARPETGPGPPADVVEAFYAAAREGDFEALVAVLDPDVVLRVDEGAGRWRKIQGSEAVARAARSFSRIDRVAVPALVGGSAGFVAFEHGRVFYVARFTLFNGKITEIDGFTDPERLRRVDLTVLEH